MKIIGFVGSHRRIGNTAWTVNKILEGAKEQGAETQVWYSSELDIKFCRGCLGCVKSGKCVIDDDMQSSTTHSKTPMRLFLVRRIIWDK